MGLGLPNFLEYRFGDPYTLDELYSAALFMETALHDYIIGESRA